MWHQSPPKVTLEAYAGLHTGPYLPGTNPNCRPGSSGLAFANDIIHGAVRRRQYPAQIQRTERARASSRLGTPVGSGVGDQSAVATHQHRMRGAPGQPILLHESESDRFEEAIEDANFARNRPVNRPLAGTAREVWVNVPRTQLLVTHPLPLATSPPNSRPSSYAITGGRLTQMSK